MSKIALKIPGFGEVTPPPNIPHGVDAPSNTLQFFMELLVMAVVVGSLIFVLYGGILWVSSGGDKAKLDKAKRTITYAIIGLIVMVFAFVIIRTIGYITGIPMLIIFGNFI